MKDINKKDFRFILTGLLAWRILLFLFLFFAVIFIPLQKDFLGGGVETYLKAPYLWSWANFDGEHYLSIAYQGYLPLTYFFFPVYPLLIRLIAEVFNQNFLTYAMSGLFISHLAFFIGLIGLIRLIEVDYKKEIAYPAIILLLLFPTSFYFGSVYTESLFLALTVWSFYFARKKRWVWAGLLGAISTATRIVGLALIPALIAELWLQKRNDKKMELLTPFFSIFLITARRSAAASGCRPAVPGQSLYYQSQAIEHR